MTLGRRSGALSRRSKASVEEVEQRLWTTAVSAADYDAATERYQAAIMEQYKLYVEMADRTSARRSLTNAFFLTLNTGILGALGLIFSGTVRFEPWPFSIAFAILSVQSVAWFAILRSYRQLSSAKFRVIGAIEDRLPASPYWRAEWAALGSGHDKSRYWPLTQLEQWVPPVFGFAYIALFVAALTR